MAFPSKRTPDQRDFVELTLSTAASGLSDVGDLGGLKLAGIGMSTAWTAADLAFLAGESSGNLRELYGTTGTSTAPGLVAYATTANRLIGVGGGIFDSARFVQLASISTGSTAAVAQAASRLVRLLLAPPGPIK